MEAILDVLHEGCYTSRITRDHPVTITVLSGHDTPEGSVGLWELAGPEAELPRVLRKLRRHKHIRRADVLDERPGAWIVETVDVEAGVSRALVKAGLVFLPPVIIQNGREVYRVFALDRGQIESAVRELTPENEVRVRILRGGANARGALANLTPAQREALETAYRMGWYDRPRRADQDGIARKLKISRPALAERLQRAERRLLEGVFG